MHLQLLTSYMIAAVSFKNQVISRGILHWTYKVQMAVSIKNLIIIGE